MAITNRLASFSLIGIKDLVVRDKTTKEVMAKLSHLVNISLSDQLSVDYLRGGFSNPKLLAIYGDRETTLTATSATMSTDLLRIMTNSITVVKTKPEQQIDDLIISGSAVTLKLMPTAGVPVTVKKLDAFGKETKLILGNPALNAGDFSISGQVVTVNTSVTGTLRVFYDADIEVETVEVKDVTPKNWEMSGLVVAKEIETGKLYKGWIEIPNGSITPNYSIQAKNEASPSDPVELVIDCLQDVGKGYPYSLSFIESV